MGVSLCEFESRSGHQKTAGRARLDSRASLEALLARRGHMEFAAFRIRTIFHVLLAWYGPQGWWPGGGPFETIVGAILTQNTSWRSVERALAGLRDSGALAGTESLDRLPLEVLERLIRPAGFRRQKAATLKRLVARASREPGGLRGFSLRVTPTFGGGSWRSRGSARRPPTRSCSTRLAGRSSSWTHTRGGS